MVSWVKPSLRLKIKQVNGEIKNLNNLFFPVEQEHKIELYFCIFELNNGNKITKLFVFFFYFYLFVTVIFKNFQLNLGNCSIDDINVNTRPVELEARKSGR